jgi:CBS domain-containing protein
MSNARRLVKLSLKFFHVREEGELDERLIRMRNGGVRRVPVVDERGRLAGILALDDMFEHLAERSPVAAMPIRREQRRHMAKHL